MKKWVKGFILAIASATLCASAVMLTGCTSAKDWLKQQRCEHTWNSGIVTTKATCSEEGETTYTCTKCDKVKKEEIAKLPHVEEIVEMKAATCTENGHTDYKKCKVCEEVLVEKKEIPALGHTEIDVAGTDATCTSKGLSDGKYCTRCEKYTIAQQEIPALGHKLVEIEKVEASCVTAGATAGIKCERCETVYTQPQVIPALGHETVNGVCKNCGEITDETLFFAQTDSMTGTAIDEDHVTTSGFYRIYIKGLGEGSNIGLADLGFKLVTKSTNDQVTVGATLQINPVDAIDTSSCIFLVTQYSETDGMVSESEDCKKYVNYRDDLDKGYITIYYTGTLWTLECAELNITVTFEADAADWLGSSNVSKVERLS